MKLMKKTLVVIVILAFCACRREKWGDKLTLPRQDYTGNELKVDGYYYRVSSDNLGNPAYEIYFLYRNGVILNGGFPLLSELPERELEFSNGTYRAQANNKTNWGRFDVNVNQIRFEKWFPSSGGPAPVIMLSGTIINDTLFHITASRESHGDNDVRSLDRYYHFKQFSPKPDSLNSYTN
jgi:hypothetical protein